MKIIQIALLLILFFGEWLPGSTAQACNPVSDKSLQALLKDKKYSEAEAWALAQVKTHTNDPGVHLALASVYLHQAFKEGLTFNSEALGIPAGESGTATITPENMEQAFKSQTQIVPEYAEKARAVLDAVVQEWPRQRSAHFCLLDLLQKSGRHPELLQAADRMGQVLKQDGTPIIDRLHHHALNYFKEKHLREATALYVVAIKHFPESGKLLSSNGVILIKMGLLEKGTGYFERAYRHNPKDPIILCNLGEANLYQQNFKRARKFLTLCLGETPKRTAIYFDLAVITMAEGPQKSIPVWKQYLKMNETTPDHPAWAKWGRQILENIESGISRDELQNLSDQLIQRGAAKLAIPLIAWQIKQDPKEPMYPFRLSQAYDQKGFHRQAYEQALRTEALLSKHPDHPLLKPSSVHFELGRLAYNLNSLDESAGYLEKSRQENPQTPNLHYMQGLVESQRGNADKAVQFFRECVNNPNNSQYVEYCRKNLKSP